MDNTTTNGQGDSALQKIPSLFFFFLGGSDLALPKIVKYEGFNIWIEKNDYRLPNLIDAAKDYCAAHDDEDSNAVLRGAKRLLWAVGFYRKQKKGANQKKRKRNHVYLKSAIETATQIFKDRGERSPSLCEVRCLINDLTSGNSPQWVYNQEKAFRKVRSGIANS